MKENKFIVSETVLNSVLTYLINQKYKDVWQLINLLQKSERYIEKEIEDPSEKNN